MPPWSLSLVAEALKGNGDGDIVGTRSVLLGLSGESIALGISIATFAVLLRVSMNYQSPQVNNRRIFSTYNFGKSLNFDSKS